MIDSTKPIDDATPLDDTSGLKLPKNKSLKILIENWPTFLIKNDPPADWNYSIKFRYFFL